MPLESDYFAFHLLGDCFHFRGSIDWTVTWTSLKHRLCPKGRIDPDGRRWVALDVSRMFAATWLPVWRADVELVSSPTPLGGLRWWWKCPKCQAKRKCLYCPPGEYRFMCRVCHDLAYSSSQKNHRFDRTITRVPGIGWAVRQMAAEGRWEESYERRLGNRRAKRRARDLARPEGLKKLFDRARRDITRRR